MDKIFLEAVSKAASDSLESISKLSDLHDKNLEKLPKTTRSKDNLRAVFDYIEQYPTIDIVRKNAGRDSDACSGERILREGMIPLSKMKNSEKIVKK